MAGLEVAGLVLGTLPIAVKAVQAYREIFHSIKYVSRDLRYIELDLRTEELRLRNTCETLLVGIVPPMQIHSMIEDPFGPEWKSYTEKLVCHFPSRLRLYTSYNVFEEHITKMLEATQELRLQLGIEEGSQINIRDSTSILQAFKRNASFTLKRKEYEGILSRIKAGNAAIQDLPGVRHDLEPDRRRRSQSRLTKLLRSLFQSLYNALHRAITCACAHSHSLGLQLSQRNAVIWASLVDFLPASKSRLSPSTTQPLTQTPTTPRTTAKTTTVPSRIVSDLCGVAHKGPGATAMKRCGYVLDAQRQFVLSHPDDSNGPQKHITLRQVIDGNVSGLPPFGFEDRLQVALALSASILHLDGTPWLSQIVTLDDIVFMVGSENNAIQKPCSWYRPFVVKSFSNTFTNQRARPPATLSTPTNQILGVGRPLNPAALSLGALLIQIMIGRVDNELDMTENMDIRSIVSKRERCSQLEEEVLVSGGINCAAAVNWCLDSIYSVAGLQNDTFCQQFYEAVVARLEDDLKLIASDV
ncbi:hypothetical protein EV127DRAFT_375848 [Xylaria flabelliformis]|nr:hypothetical protein EV127DRAFT_375848 [Xylaria flabelliformis]